QVRAATRDMYRQGRFARAQCHISPSGFGSFGSQASKKDIWPALQHNLIPPRGNLQNAIRVGVSRITTSQIGASAFVAVGRKASAVGVGVDQSYLDSAVACWPGSRIRIRDAIEAQSNPRHIARRGT